MSAAASSLVAGVDGCRGGWVAVVGRIDAADGASLERVELAGTLGELLCRRGGDRLACLAVDVPIGLASSAEPGGRPCDRSARAALGRARGSSVFSAPCRPVVEVFREGGGYAEALAASRASGPAAVGLTKQAWNIAAKIAEADELATPRLQRSGRLVECHPELVFARLAGSGGALAPVTEPKRTPAGRARRLALLASAGLARGPAGLDALTRPGRSADGSVRAAADDVVDALACLLCAARVAAGSANRFGGEPDDRGLAMEIRW